MPFLPPNQQRQSTEGKTAWYWYCLPYMASKSQRTGSNASSIRSPGVNEERMMPGHILGLLFYAVL